MPFIGRCSGRILAHQAAAQAQDVLREASVAGGGRLVNARCEHGDGWPAAVHRRLMDRSVNAKRESGHRDQLRQSVQLLDEQLRERDAVGAGSTRTDDRYERSLENARIAAHEQSVRRVSQLRQQRRVAFAFALDHRDAFGLDFFRFGY